MYHYLQLRMAIATSELRLITYLGIVGAAWMLGGTIWAQRALVLGAILALLVQLFMPAMVRLVQRSSG